MISVGGNNLMAEQIKLHDAFHIKFKKHAPPKSYKHHGYFTT